MKHVEWTAGRTFLITTFRFKAAAIAFAAIYTIGCTNGLNCETEQDCEANDECFLGECVALQSMTNETDVGNDQTGSPEPLCASGEFRFNEVVSDVPLDTDYDGDGSRDAYGDEFIELINLSTTEANLGGIQLLVNGDFRTYLPNICVPPFSGVVVFGSDADSTFRLSNDGTFLELAGNGKIHDRVEVPRTNGRSYARDPDVDGPFRLFDVASPGRCADGRKLEVCMR